MSLIVQNTSATTRIVDPRDYSLNFLSSSAVQISEDSPDGSAFEWEMTFDTVSGATVRYDYQVDTINTATLENLSPSIASMSDTGFVTRISDGLAHIKATFDSGATKSIWLDMNEKPAETYRIFASYVGDSLPDLLTDSVLDLVTPGKTDTYYSVFNHETANYVRDASCWAAGLDLTGCPVASDIRGWGPENRGAAVTARHVVGAKHWNVYSPATEMGAGYSIGNKLRFAESDGTTHERTIIGRASHLDLIVVTLDSDLPAGISPIPIVGEWYFAEQDTTTPGIKYGYSGGMIFYINQNGEAKYLLSGNLNGRWGLTPTTHVADGDTWTFWSPGYSTSKESIEAAGVPSFLDGKMDFYQEGVGGDSGSAVMALVDGVPSLVWTWWSSTSGVPVWNENGAILNALISDSDASASVDTGYTVTVTPAP